jgi:hypothetical protein
VHVNRPVRLRDPSEGLRREDRAVFRVSGPSWLAAAIPFLPLTRLDGVTGPICDRNDAARRMKCV